MKMSLLVSLLCLILPIENVSAQSDTVAITQLSGSAYNRGLQHGSRLKDQIAAVFSKWKTTIRRNTNQHPDTVLSSFLRATRFIAATQKYAPQLLEEVKGIADGAGQPFNDVFAFQLVDEFWVYLDELRHTGGHHCSGMGVASTPKHPAYIAQNIDLENYMQGYQALLHIAATQSEPEQYIVTCAGLVALGGINEKGIALCMNSLMELKGSEDGLPVAFMVRCVLEKQTGNEALEFLQRTKHAAGQNYIVGIADSVYDFEASANEVVRYIPSSGSNVVYHTNHALVNHDVKEWYSGYHKKVMAGDTQNGNSEIRFASLQQRLSKKTVSQEMIKETLRSKDDVMNPVCRVFKENGGGFTFCSVVYTLTGKVCVQLTNGSPDQSQYKAYFFRAVPVKN